MSTLSYVPPAFQQDQLVQSGVIPRLVSIMKEYPENDPLVNVCLLALCNLADMGKYSVIILFIVMLFGTVMLFRCVKLNSSQL